MAIDLKTATPDTSFGSGAFLFGADSQSASVPSVYSVDDVFGYLLGLSNTWTGQQTFAAGTITASTPLSITQTWNDGGTTFTGLNVNVTDTASDANSLLMDLQVGGTSKFKVNKIGGATFSSTLNSVGFYSGTTAILQGAVYLNNAGFVGWGPSGSAGSTDTILTRKGPANLRLGSTDAAAPVAQTLSVQSVIAGTTDTSGQPFTIQGSAGTGSGAGGSIIFQVAPAGSSGTGQNTLVTRLELNSAGVLNFGISGGGAGLQAPSSNLLNVTQPGGGLALVQIGVNGVRLRSQYEFGWSSDNNAGNPSDLILARDTSNTLALRNGGTDVAKVPQTFNIYNYHASASDYERASILYESNQFKIKSEAAGNGNLRDITIYRSYNRQLQASGSGIYFWHGSGSSTGFGLVPDEARHGSITIGFSAGNASTASDAGIKRIDVAHLGITDGSDGLGSLSLGHNSSGTDAFTSLNITPTWNTTGAPTAIKLNVTDTASDNNSLLMDLQVDGISKFRVRNSGNFLLLAEDGNISTTSAIIFNRFNTSRENSTSIYGSYNELTCTVSNQTSLSILGTETKLKGISRLSWCDSLYATTGTSDLFISRKGPANLLLGSTDAAAPVAQTLSVQSVVAGTTDTSGQPFTIQGSAGTGSGAGGSIIFQVAPAGSSGTGQNTLVDALTIGSDKNIGISAGSEIFAGTFCRHVFGANFHTFHSGGRSMTYSSGGELSLTGGGFQSIFVYQIKLGSASATSSSFYGDASNTISLRNSTDAQTFNIYNTFTDASNYERAFLSWSRESNTFYIGTEGVGSGTDTRSVKIRSAGGVYDFGSVGFSISRTNLVNTAMSIQGSNAKASFGTGNNLTYWGSETNDPLELRTNNNAKLKLDTVGSVEITTGLTVSTLPGTPAVGMIARVTDGDSGLTFGQVVINSGSGATPYLVWYNGTNWTVIGA